MADALPAPLTTLAQVRDYLATSKQSVFYVSATATNLLGLDHWVGGFRYVTMVDSWDGQHPRVFSPSRVPKLAPRGNINIVNWLLQHPEVQAHIAEHTPAGFTPQIALAMFDETSERLCRELGYELIMPKLALRQRIDSKLETTRLGNEAGAPSVPNILATLTGWDDLVQQASEAGLGADLVVQLPYGDSGRTTYFVANADDYSRVAAEITGTPVKVMKRINHLSLSAEAIVMAQGTILGPVLREITGYPELISSRGGWAGSELYPGFITAETEQSIHTLMERFCERLRAEGYRGTVSIDILLDTDTGETYLGELNPRISGSSSHSNLTVPSPAAAAAHPDSAAGGPAKAAFTLPLFAFHVLEFSGAKVDLDFAAINRDHLSAFADQVWTTLIIQHTPHTNEQVTAAPTSGRYRITGEGTLELVRPELDWHELESADEAYFLRTMSVGSVRGRGNDVGVLMLRRRAQEEHYALKPESVRLIQSAQALYEARRISVLRVYWRGGLRRLRELFRR